MINKRKLFSIALISAAILLVSISIAGASGDFILQKTATTNNQYDPTTYSAVGQKITYNYFISDWGGYGGAVVPIVPAPMSIAVLCMAVYLVGMVANHLAQ